VDVGTDGFGTQETSIRPYPCKRVLGRFKSGKSCVVMPHLECCGNEAGAKRGFQYVQDCIKE
jgi:hypothetical protein